MEPTASPQVFLITGVGAGLGRAFATAALADGHTVIGTLRTDEARAAFERLLPGRAHGVLLDVTDFDAIGPAVAAATRVAGPVDVLVNNAGYGHEGTLEESSLDALRHQFDVNVFGAVAMIKAVLPSMRERRRGHIVNVTSLAGFVAAPGIPYYAGSKFALEGISESLAQELRGFGIRVSALAPGAFRTDWAGRSLVRTGRSIADYDAVFEPVRAARRRKDGRQPGDPARAARVLLDLVRHDDPPVHLLLGNDALLAARHRLAQLATEVERWKDVSASTDFDAEADAVLRND
ncbi:oxidoreductase [Burkholderia perseverans]|uniref:oxidoreductase n=1 Tax=Burkholderia perseverans TaxID=2615214 RepID=UPI001FEF6C65|nr:oxidoreductase [Burkholderia perseverans]